MIYVGIKVLPHLDEIKSLMAHGMNLKLAGSGSGSGSFCFVGSGSHFLVFNNSKSAGYQY